ncbi:hypothetical protein X011_13700 [Mycobacterium tuberculosis variant microti OV254]|nr:hypothetical protein X011_13700 [Mycobacterium tuberculosis variant microti OV254]
MDLFDSLIAFVCQIGKIVLKANHAIIRSVVGVFLNAVLSCNLSRVLFPLPESFAKIVRRMAPLVTKRAQL